MERKQSKKVKALGASGVSGNTVKKESRQQSNEQLLSLLISNKFKVRTGLIPAHSSMRQIGRTTRRFIFGTNFSGSITMGDLCSQFLVATSATAVATYVDSWRAKKYTVYARNNEADYSVQVQVTPGNAATADNNMVVNVPQTYAVESQSSSRATILEIIPSPLTAMGCWHRANTTNSTGILASIACSSGGGSIDGNTMMDIDFEYILNIFGALQGFTVTGLSGLTIGSLYAASICAGLVNPLDINKAF